MVTKDTPNGRILSYCPVTPEMEVAADECFAAYKRLNELVEKFCKTIPEGYSIKNFYGRHGECVVIQETKEIEAEAKYWEENS